MLWKRKIVIDDNAITEGAGLTLKQSLVPCGLGEHWFWPSRQSKILITTTNYYPLLPLGF